jgi:methionine sulfoxide reductase heme-binding subunit
MRIWKFTPLQIAVHIAAWVPLIWLVWAYANHRLTVNPIQTSLQDTGLYALVLLVLCLACTPIKTVTGWRGVMKVRRALGLYSFFYAAIHVSILVGWDYQFNFKFLYADFRGKLYIWMGLAVWLILFILAATASRWTIRRLGKNWKRIHRLIYPAGILVVLHYAWAKKGDLFHLRGDISQPLFYGLVVIVLLVLRIPLVVHGLKQTRARLLRLGSRIKHHDWLARFKRVKPEESGVPRSP